jgi:hypothetical protein
MYVKTGAGRFDGGNCVPVIGHRQLYGIEVAATDQLTKINIGAAVAVAVLLVYYFFGAVKMTLVDIADGYHLHLGPFQEAPHITCPLRADAYRSHDYPVAWGAGPKDRCRDNCRQGDGRARGSDSSP